MSTLPRLMMAIVLLGSAACAMPLFAPLTASGGAQDPATRDACAAVCSKYLECKGSQDRQALDECVATCNPESVAPGRLESLTAMDCDTFVATAEGRAPAPGGTVEQAAARPAAGGGGLAGVWVAEENSLDPGIYMSFTQYLTFYPDGSVSYTKAEGGASRSQVSENWVRFRSWREGAPPARVVGRWSSDGAQVSVQFSSKNAQGRVRGPNEISLSRMGVLEEGATLTFKRQP